jgi:hypothetical protein
VPCASLNLAGLLLRAVLGWDFDLHVCMHGTIDRCEQVLML